MILCKIYCIRHTYIEFSVVQLGNVLYIYYNIRFWLKDIGRKICDGIIKYNIYICSTLHMFNLFMLNVLSILHDMYNCTTHNMLQFHIYIVHCRSAYYFIYVYTQMYLLLFEFTQLNFKLFHSSDSRRTQNNIHKITVFQGH